MYRDMYGPTGFTQYSDFVIVLSEAPPVKLKKYTYKQVIEMVNSLEGNDYTEILTLQERRINRGRRR